MSKTQDPVADNAQAVMGDEEAIQSVNENAPENLENGVEDEKQQVGLSETLKEAPRVEENIQSKEGEEDDDDLEEGELKDDEDEDDDEEELENQDENTSESALDKSKASDDESDQQSSSSSSSPSSNHSKERNSSRSSSRLESNKKFDSNSSLDFRNSRATNSKLANSNREERFRAGWKKEEEDPTEKAAKLISMRTKLLEARAREIEMKFQKHRGPLPKIVTTSSPLTGTLSLTTSSVASTQSSHDNVKMTVAKPSISYSENPNPPSATSEAIEAYTSAKKKLKSKSSSRSDDERSKKSKKRSKKRKKSGKTSRKHKRHRGDSGSKKRSISSHRLDSNSQDLDISYDNSINNDHHGPRTPPDNHVLTLENEQIEWPSHLIKMTLTQPSISYSVNPKADEDYHKYSMLPSAIKVSNVNDIDLNTDYNWYYDYYINSMEMDHNQAQHQAHLAILSAGNYQHETLVKWFSTKGLEIQSGEVVEEEKKPQTPKEPNKETRILATTTDAVKIDQESAKDEVIDNPELDVEVKTAKSADVMVDMAVSNDPEPIKDDKQIDIVEDVKSEDTIRVKNESTEELESEPSHELIPEAKPDVDLPQEKLDSEGDQALKADLETDKGEVTGNGDGDSEKIDEGVIHKRPIKPTITIIKSHKEIVLPNGQVLPAGTIQKVVHPYPKLKSELLGPYFDMY